MEQPILQRRIEEAVKSIKKTRVTKGAVIWKIYNDGYVVKTPSVTLGFDLVGRYGSDVGEFAISKDIMKQLVDECDILFISRHHPDHYAKKWVIRRVIEKGKKVVSPPYIWPDQPIYDSLTHLPRVADSVQKISIQNGKQTLKVVIYPFLVLAWGESFQYMKK